MSTGAFQPVPLSAHLHINELFCCFLETKLNEQDSLLQSNLLSWILVVLIISKFVRITFSSLLLSLLLQYMLLL